MQVLNAHLHQAGFSDGLDGEIPDQVDGNIVKLEKGI
jgi:hypothetical protein